MAFTCNPINPILIYPTRHGYFAKEVAKAGKGVKIIEQCTGKHSPKVAKDQFTRMGYENIQILEPLTDTQATIPQLIK